MNVAIYLRVSTSGQTVDNQRLELQRVAAARGWQIVAEFADEGVSGAKGRDRRPAFDKLLKGATRHDFDMVAAWSIDRLGRSLADLAALLVELQSLGVGIYLHQQAIDSSTPGGRALLQMAGVFAEFERAMLIERVNAGLARAKQHGTRSGKAIGRPMLTPAKQAAVRAALIAGNGVRATARECGVSKASVAAIRDAAA